SLCLVCAIAIVLAVSSRLKADEPLTPEQVSQNVAKVVERVRSFKPVEPENDNQQDIYIFDVETGKIEVAFDDPTLELGTPYWSEDGSRILFDATPGRKWNLTQIMMLDASKDDAEVTMLGFGNRPTISPDGKQICYRLYGDNLPDTEQGTWVLNLDGSDMRPLGTRSFPRWSPDGKTILISKYDAAPVFLYDAKTLENQELILAGHEISSNPDWIDLSRHLAAIVRTPEDEKIAVIDISQPDHCRIERVLWENGNGIDVEIIDPVYSAVSGKCVFGGNKENQGQLYILDDKQKGPPQAVKISGPVDYLEELAMSPDGRYVLFCSYRDIRKLLKEQTD
ncbi:MAG: PD40 domain-containing protein, partial [Planctomycetaceae bacterium]|nr:PD40 domain-containing protein [Planctomycetaceae bacterium]